MSRSARAPSSARGSASRLRGPAQRLAGGAALLALGLGLGSCLNPIQLEPEGYTYRAVIRWTGNGVPHILADDLPSAAYGQGWAFTRLNGCILADQVVKVRSERSLFFGRGENDQNLQSDLVLKHLRVYENAEQGLPQQSELIRSLVEAYAAGYNDYVAQHREELPCADEDWLRPITPVDLFAHYVEVAQLASSRQAHDLIYAAGPDGEGLALDSGVELSDLRDNRPGSNGWAIGRERSANGHGMLVANPHFPWEGELKLFESHIKVPGQIDVYGAGLMGVVGILIGFNENVAWTHTVSDGQRLTIYQLELDPDDPTRYRFDGEYRQMEADPQQVQVLEEDGTITTASHTFYRTHQGSLVALPGLSLPTLGFAIRDANLNNQQLIPQFIGMNLSKDLDDFIRVHDEVKGIPWVNTMATSRDGRAFYIDATPTPNLSQAAIDHWLEARETDFFTIQLDDNGLVLLPGNSSEFDWVEEPGARDPGLIPAAKLPRLERADFVFNANDSHWLTNPLEPLTGYSPMHGFEGTPRSPRTRMNAVTLLDRDGSMSGPEGKFDLDELRGAILSNRSLPAELLVDAVVARCQGAGPVSYGGTSVDVSAACDALATWDRHLELDSVGAVVFRELLGDFDPETHYDAGALYAEPFDPGTPTDATSAVDTPRGLAPAPQDPQANDRILEALAGAVVRLGQARIPLTAPLGDVQYTVRSGERIPLHGGTSIEGVTNLVVYSKLDTTLGDKLERPEPINTSTGLTEQGYLVQYGSSFVMAMRFTDDAPEAFAFLTYGQSDDPDSPYHTDQTHRFSHKDWRQVLYTEDQIENDPDLEVEVIFGFSE
ncbi:MAG: penicillin acylase family protein [Myxococcales bacterium]|nr:penicillin acylase family protein [Myxococcales bacterium]MCB9713899.1 penicillin acylase family protein [Myxococcales bacterium]